jgi:hypothetical protein
MYGEKGLAGLNPYKNKKKKKKKTTHYANIILNFRVKTSKI